MEDAPDLEIDRADGGGGMIAGHGDRGQAREAGDQIIGWSRHVPLFTARMARRERRRRQRGATIRRGIAGQAVGDVSYAVARRGRRGAADRRAVLRARRGPVLQCRATVTAGRGGSLGSLLAFPERVPRQEVRHW